MSKFISSFITLLVSLFLTCPLGMAIMTSATDSARQDTAARELKEIVVEGEQVIRRGQNYTYIVTKDMRRDVKEAGELLGKLPGVYYNPLSKEVRYLFSKNIVILVDSIPKDQEYIKRLRPYRFDHITIVNNPTGQYDGYDAIINFHTRPDYDGYESNGITQISVVPDGRNGDGQDFKKHALNLDFTYTNRKVTVSAFGGYVSDRNGTSSRYVNDYKLNDLVETTLARPMRDPADRSKSFEAAAHLSVSYEINQNNSISAIWKIEPANTTNLQNQTMLTGRPGGRPDTIGYSSRDKSKHMLRNYVGLFYRGRFGLWNVNATATYNTYSNDTYSDVWRSDGFSLTNNRRNGMDYFWGGADVSRGTKNGKWFFQLSDVMTWVKYSQHRLGTEELLSNNKTVRNTTQLTAQFYPSRKLSMGVNAGFNVDKNIELRQSDTHVTPQLGAWMAYFPNRKVMARLNYSTSTMSPQMAQLQSYGQFTDSLIYRVGNPWLAPATTHNVQLTVGLWNKLFFKASYRGVHNSIFQMAGVGDGLRPDNIVGPYIIYDYRNGQSGTWRGAVSYNSMFGKHWNLYADVSVCRSSVSLGAEKHSLVAPEYSWVATYVNQKYDLQLTLSSSLNSATSVTPQQYYKGLSDRYAFGGRKGFFNSALMIYWVYYFPFHIADGNTRSIFTSPGLDKTVWYDNQSRINNYFEVSVVYRIQGGKSVKKYKNEFKTVE